MTANVPHATTNGSTTTRTRIVSVTAVTDQLNVLAMTSLLPAKNSTV